MLQREGAAVVILIRLHNLFSICQQSRRYWLESVMVLFVISKISCTNKSKSHANVVMSSINNLLKQTNKKKMFFCLLFSNVVQFYWKTLHLDTKSLLFSLIQFYHQKINFRQQTSQFWITELIDDFIDFV